MTDGLSDWLFKESKPPDWKLLRWADYGVYWFQSRTGIAKYQWMRAAWVLFISISMLPIAPLTVVGVVCDVALVLLVILNWLMPGLRRQQEIADKLQHPLLNPLMFTRLSTLARVLGYMIVFVGIWSHPGHRFIGGLGGFSIFFNILLVQLNTWPRTPRRKKMTIIFRRKILRVDWLPKENECREFWNVIPNPA